MHDCLCVTADVYVLCILMCNLTDWRFIYLQKLTGTVTIVPDAPLWSYFRVISDPNHAAMEQYILTGERATWYKLCRISNHYRVEKTLIECSRFLEKEAAKQGLPLHKERVSHLNSMPDQIVNAEHASPGGGAAASKTNAAPRASHEPRLAPDHAVAASAASSSSSASAPLSAHDRSDEKHAQAAGSGSAAPSSGASSANSSHKKKRPHQGKKQRNAAAAAAAKQDTAGTSGDDAPSSTAVLGSDTEEVDDVLMSRDSEGEIAHTMTSQLLGGTHLHHRSMLPLHQQKQSLEHRRLESHQQLLWQRGQDTDTDTNSDEELEAEEIARRRRFDLDSVEPAPSPSPSPNE